MTWAGTAVAAQVTTPRAREIIAAVALTALGIVALTAALVFDATMAIFSPLSAYALVIGWVASQRRAWLGPTWALFF